MPTYDQRVAHFRDEMARILNQKVEFPIGSFVTVMDAKMTTDLRFANVVLSVMPVAMEEAVGEALKDYSNDIRKEMASKLHLRHMPNLHWSFDHTEEKAEKIEKYIEDLKQKGEI